MTRLAGGARRRRCAAASRSPIIEVAIAVMAKSPVPGFVKTRLCPPLSARQAAEMYRALLCDTLAAVERSHAAHCVVLAAPEHDGVERLQALISPRTSRRWTVIPQRGRDLGERLDHGIEDLLAAGVRGALIASSDTPFIDPRELDEAGAWLVESPRRAIIGPASDGGYYLIGLGRREASIFHGVAWSTGTVGLATLDRMVAAGLVVRETTALFDIDDADDLMRFASAPRQKSPACARALATLGLG